MIHLGILVVMDRQADLARPWAVQSSVNVRRIQMSDVFHAVPTTDPGVPGRAEPARSRLPWVVPKSGSNQSSAGFSNVYFHAAAPAPRWARALGRAGAAGTACGQLRPPPHVDLDDLPIVGHQAVHFDLDVGRLRVDGGGQPARSAAASGEQVHVGVGQLLRRSRTTRSPSSSRPARCGRRRACPSPPNSPSTTTRLSSTGRMPGPDSCACRDTSPLPWSSSRWLR